MPKKRRKFHRQLGERRYNKLIVIAAEGRVTELEYLVHINSFNHAVNVHCLQGDDKSSPAYVLKRMKQYLKNEKLRKSDEAWVIVDRDQWSDGDLQQLFNWASEKPNYHVAINNPCFEHWLLQHFEDVRGAVSIKVCHRRLRKHLPDYDKSIDLRQITRERVMAAIERARQCESSVESFVAMQVLVGRIVYDDQNNAESSLK